MVEATEKVEARHFESTASAVGDGIDSEGSKAQGREQGPSKKVSNSRNLESSSLDSSDWESSSGAGKGGSGTGGGSNDTEGGLV